MGVFIEKETSGTVTVLGEIITSVVHEDDLVMLKIKDEGAYGDVVVCIRVEDAKEVLDKLAAQIEVCIREKDLQDQTIALGIQEDYNV